MTTRESLIYQLTTAKKAVADIEGALARACPEDAPRITGQLRRAEVYRDNLVAVLADYDAGMIKAGIKAASTLTVTTVTASLAEKATLAERKGAASR